MANNIKSNKRATEDRVSKLQEPAVESSTNPSLVNSIESLEARMALVRRAQAEYAQFTQDQVDQIFKAAAMAANNQRINLAISAVEETKMGLVEDKVIKNHFACEYIYNQYKDAKTCGVIEQDDAFGITKVAEPVGVVAAVIPTTNPTSTAIFKILLALKTRNGIVLSPHPRAKKCTIEAARIMAQAAESAGAPKNLIGWIDEPSLELTQNIMSSSDLILATGGPGMVKAAYSSGKPAIGVGAGNTPAIIDETADIKMAVSSILLSKSFDNGVICASEQSVLVVDSVYSAVRAEFSARGAYLLTPQEVEKMRSLILVKGHLNGAIVGQSAYAIAKMVGIDVPQATKVLIGEVESVERDEAFSHEKLSPVLAMYRVGDFEGGLVKAARLVELGGYGHTSVLYTDSGACQDRVSRFGDVMKTGRIIVNMPASQGAIGDIYNFRLAPSLTLGCGSWGGNAVSENVGVKHLLNIKVVAQRRENMLWFRVPERIYIKSDCLAVALGDLKEMGKRKVFIVTDKVLYDLGFAQRVTGVLDNLGIVSRVFFEVEQDPTLATARAGAAEMQAFGPDAIIALGGGSPMDAAKMMWVLYEHPEVCFEDLAMRFMDIRKRVYAFPKMGTKASFVAIPTSAGTGSEVTPFAVITDERSGVKYPLADYALTPNMAIVDAALMHDMPPGLTAASGIDALTHAIEAYASVVASDLTNGHALEAIRLIFKYLPAAYRSAKSAKSAGAAGASAASAAVDFKAREKMAHASTMAGMAFANAFLGLCHSMAHKLGAYHHIPHGVANALLINSVIRFNAADNPTKQATFAQYKYPSVKARYARISDYLGLTRADACDDAKVEALCLAIDQLKGQLDLPQSIEGAGISREAFDASLQAMSLSAFDDQCTGANPRYPLIDEIKGLYQCNFGDGAQHTMFEEVGIS